MPDPTSDLLIIGAGPAGCTAALYGARAGLKTVMSSPTELAGMMASAAVVANFPGQVEPVAGRDLLARIRAQVLQAGAEHVLEAVAGVDFGDPEQLIVYGGHQEHRPRAVIVATGATGRLQKAPGEAEFLGRGVCYCAACDGPFFAGEDIIVVGDDAQAAEEALTLAKLAHSVRLVSAAPQLQMDWELQQALEECSNVEVQAGLKLERIVGEDAVTGAAFQTPDGQERLLPGAGVFLYLRGNAPATDFLAGALHGDEQGYLVTDELLETSVPGVFAAGDVRHKPVRQMVVAAGEGACAALAAERHIHKSARIRLDRGAGGGPR
ncbi:MAG: FAD-dependent oxidoreductase [Armatimonadota bacterium]